MIQTQSTPDHLRLKHLCSTWLFRAFPVQSTQGPPGLHWPWLQALHQCALHGIHSDTLACTSLTSSCTEYPGTPRTTSSLAILPCCPLCREPGNPPVCTHFSVTSVSRVRFAQRPGIAPAHIHSSLETQGQPQYKMQQDASLCKMQLSQPAIVIKHT